MEQEPIPISELLFFILYFGSISFLLGVIYQVIILYRNKKPWFVFVIVILFTRILTVIASYFIWAYWPTKFDIMFLCFYMPGLFAEIIFSPLILKLFGNKLIKDKVISQESKE